tara:strand:+ start:8668 stop:9177 length:510 start_codon:yes stop_codon:yes gene_type:complete
MAYKAINNLQTIDIDSLDAGSATKEYPLGTVITINDTSKAAAGEFIYIKAHAGFATVGTPFQIVAGSVLDAEFRTRGISTLVSGANIGFNTTAITIAHYFWAQTSGILTAAAKAGITAGDFVKVDNSETDVETDGTTLTVNSIGIAKTSTADSAVTLAIIPNRTVTISA